MTAAVPKGRVGRDLNERMIMRHRLFAIAATLVFASPLIAGCGDDDDDDGSGDAAKAPAADSALTIEMSEFAFDPDDATATAGTVEISAPNKGHVVHELVILKTDADPAKLPMAGDEVDESTAVGEIPDVEPGATKTQTFKLEPGKYAMVCALPGHYEGGMYGSLTVK
jgi:uncharacterized cupredoxin-like copper-binding protein